MCLKTTVSTQDFGFLKANWLVWWRNELFTGQNHCTPHGFPIFVEGFFSCQHDQWRVWVVSWCLFGYCMVLYRILIKISWNAARPYKYCISMCFFSTSRTDKAIRYFLIPVASHLFWVDGMKITSKPPKGWKKSCCLGYIGDYTIPVKWGSW